MSYKTKKISFAIILTLGLIGLIYMQNHLKIAEKELEVISGTLNGEPVFDTGAHGHWYMEIKLNEFHDRRFQTDGFSYHVLKKDLIRSELEDGSKINVLIRNENAKNWVDEINRNMNLYDIIALNDGHHVFVSLSDYNKYRQDDFWLAYLFWAIFFGLYIYWILKNKRTITSTKSHGPNNHIREARVS